MASSKNRGMSKEGMLALLKELPTPGTDAFVAAQSCLSEATGLKLSQPLVLFVTAPQMYEKGYRCQQDYMKG